MSARLACPDELASRIDAVLPQTQCSRCGYDGCAPYARAVAEGEAVNRCPPGGDIGVARIAAIVGRPVLPLDTSLGVPGPLQVARIDEAWCIGCTLCIQACPVDAIVGGPKRMHAVISALCTGCELCIAPCPVDCIGMTSAGRAWSDADAEAARARYGARNARLASLHDDTTRAAASLPATPAHEAAVAELTADERHAAVAQALARARARRRVATRA
jgi:electron transport complex protein RnfB